MSELYNISVKDIDMNSVDLRTYEGKTLLIVNVASKVALLHNIKIFKTFMKNIKSKD